METQEMSPTIGKLAAALCDAQAMLKPAKENAVNPFFKSKYADLASIWEACKEPFRACELSVAQTFEKGAEEVVIVTYLLHSSGEWLKGSLPIKPKTNDPQGIGSAITYGRRYALAAMVGVCPADDDAESAMGRTEPPKKPLPFKPATRPSTNQLKAEVAKLVGELGYTPDTTQEWKDQVKKLTQEELEPSNYETIIDKLKILKAEK